MVIAVAIGMAAPFAPGAGAARAEAVAEEAPIQANILAQLQEQGYSNVTVRRTLLGRHQIVGLRDGARREIILNP